MSSLSNGDQFRSFVPPDGGESIQDLFDRWSHHIRDRMVPDVDSLTNKIISQNRDISLLDYTIKLIELAYEYNDVYLTVISQLVDAIGEMRRAGTRPEVLDDGGELREKLKSSLLFEEFVAEGVGDYEAIRKIAQNAQVIGSALIWLFNELPDEVEISYKGGDCSEVLSGSELYVRALNGAIDPKEVEDVTTTGEWLPPQPSEKS